MKARLKGAQKGHSLLKKKSDALTLRFRKILKTIIEVSKCIFLPKTALIQTTVTNNVIGVSSHAHTHTRTHRTCICTTFPFYLKDT